MADEMMEPAAPMDTDQVVDPATAEVEGQDDGSVVVKSPAPAEGMPEEAANLVPFFLQHADPVARDEVTLDLPKRIIDEFDEDWASTENWREKRRKRNKLRYGNLDPKQYPFENCANAHFPVMLERELRLATRMYAEIFPTRDYVYNAIPSNYASTKRAEIVNLHSNWQIRKEIGDFFCQNRRAIFEFIGNGDCVMHSYRDLQRGVNRHEMLSCEEVVWPYVWKTTAVDMSDVPRKTRILRKYKNELLDLEEAGVLAQVEKLLEDDKKGKWSRGTFDDGIETGVHDDMDEVEGREKPDDSTVAYYTILEWHGWFQFPGEERERPVVAKVEYRSGLLMGLYIREQEDPKDLGRYDKQKKDVDQYNHLLAQYQEAQRKMQEVALHLQQPHIPMEEAAMLQQAMMQEPLPPPQPAKWMKLDPVTGQAGPPDPVKIIPIEQFSHGRAIENVDGSLGLGIGLLLEGFNETVDTLASQYIDSATLANLATAIMPDSVQMEPGDNRLVPGEIHRVRGVSTEQLQGAFKVIQFPPANPQMLEMIKLQLENADGVSSAPDVLSGEAGKANETYRGIATRVEQATKQLTVLAQNYLEFLANVLKNNARLNYVFLDDYELRTVIDPRDNEAKQIELSRDLYRDDYEIEFTADTRFSSKVERIAEADQLLGLASKALPPPIAAMIFPPEFFREAVARALKARGLHDMVSYLRTPEQIKQMQQAQAQQAQAQQETKVAAAGHLPDLEAAQQRKQQQAMMAQMAQQGGPRPAPGPGGPVQ